MEKQTPPIRSFVSADEIALLSFLYDSDSHAASVPVRPEKQEVQLVKVERKVTVPLPLLVHYALTADTRCRQIFLGKRNHNT